MPSLLQVLLVLVIFGLPALVFIGKKRMGGVTGRRSGASSGLAAGLADINAILQPQHPTADAIAKAEEVEDEHEDEGDEDDPEDLAPPRPGS